MTAAITLARSSWFSRSRRPTTSLSTVAAGTSDPPAPVGSSEGASCMVDPGLVLGEAMPQALRSVVKLGCRGNLARRLEILPSAVRVDSGEARRGGARCLQSGFPSGQQSRQSRAPSSYPLWVCDQCSDQEERHERRYPASARKAHSDGATTSRSQYTLGAPLITVSASSQLKPTSCAYSLIDWNLGGANSAARARPCSRVNCPSRIWFEIITSSSDQPAIVW